jgi:hypothetical protein
MVDQALLTFLLLTVEAEVPLLMEPEAMAVMQLVRVKGNNLLQEVMAQVVVVVATLFQVVAAEAVTSQSIIN